MTPISKSPPTEDAPALSIRKAIGEEPQLNAGDAVKILVRYPVGHYRVPHFIRGKRGLIEQVIEPRAVNNEEEGFGRNVGIKGFYYRVAIPLTELWPDYTGSPQDGLRMKFSRPGWRGFKLWIRKTIRTTTRLPPDASATAPGYYEIMETSVRELLIEKKLIEPGEIRRQIEVLRLAHARPRREGRGLTPGWIPRFARASSPTAAPRVKNSESASTMTRSSSSWKTRRQFTTSSSARFVPCYPRPVLGLPPDWYKAKPYRARAVKEPRKVLAEFGTDIPEDVEIRVSDSTAAVRYLVLPQRPPETANFSEEQLAALVTRDAMIGVVKISAPSPNPL